MTMTDTDSINDFVNADMQAVYAFIQPNGGFANRRKRSPTDTW